jgi:osmotically-inducible protein OsmY
MSNSKPFNLVTLAIAGTVASFLSGCATFGKCDSASCGDDAKITKAVDSALDRQSDLFPPNAISVQTSDHVVYLNGVADSFGSETAESTADQVPGVARVVNSVTDDNQ